MMNGSNMWSPFTKLLIHWPLASSLTKREIIGRYKGSVLGLFWSVFHPLFMLAIYTFIFSVVFNARWPGVQEDKISFALLLFSGLIVFNFFSECINKAPTIILNNSNYVKKVIFPVEILAWVNIGSAIFHTMISLFIWLFFYIISFGSLHWTILLTPVIFMPIVFISIGITWFLSSLGVYFRDIVHITSLIITVLMFMSPIFYPIQAIPEIYRDLLKLNPLFIPIKEMREVLFFGTVPSIKEYFFFLLESLVILYVGYAWFMKTKKGFSDVL